MTDWPLGHIHTVADIEHAWVRAGWAICDVCEQWFDCEDPDAHGGVCGDCCYEWEDALP